MMPTWLHVDKTTVGKIAEVFAVRASPGAVNFAAIVILGIKLDTDFGLFSTALATALALGSVAFGPVTLSIVGHYAREAVRSDREYVGGLISLALTIFVFAVLGDAALAAFQSEMTGVGTIVGSFGMLTLFQAILRARLQFWLFGASALLQASIFCAGALLIVRDVPTALAVSAGSYLAGSLLSYLLCGCPRPGPVTHSVKASVRTGAPLTIGKMAETALLLGVRYIVLIFGSAQALSIFSFCVDVAQRSAGFALNLVSFSLIPRAFRNYQTNRDPQAFSDLLLKGLTVSVALAAGSVAAVVVFDTNSLWQGRMGPLFDVVTFLVVSLAVLADRSAKLVAVPLAMQKSETWRVAIAYLVGAAVSAGVAVVAPPSIAFVAGYCIAAAGCFTVFLSYQKQ